MISIKYYKLQTWAWIRKLDMLKVQRMTLTVVKPIIYNGICFNNLDYGCNLRSEERRVGKEC